MLSKVVTVLYIMSIWMTQPNFIGRGRGVLFDELLGTVATSLISIFFSLSFVDMEKSCDAVCWISLIILSMFRKPKDFLR